MAVRRKIWVIVVISMHVTFLALYTERWILDPKLHGAGQYSRRGKVQEDTVIRTRESKSILYTGALTEGYYIVVDNVHQWLTGVGVREGHDVFVVIDIDSG